jgi:hypothetical protein
MRGASATLFDGVFLFGTEVPKLPMTFVRHQETIRTISARGRIRKT